MRSVLPELLLPRGGGRGGGDQDVEEEEKRKGTAEMEEGEEDVNTC